LDTRVEELAGAEIRPDTYTESCWCGYTMNFPWRRGSIRVWRKDSRVCSWFWQSKLRIERASPKVWSWSNTGENTICGQAKT
jgi:hypothetical protein